MKWRSMTTTDIPVVKALADSIHKSYPEDEAIFAERLRLYPAGCAVLVAGKRVLGYCVAHPWLYGNTPAVNSLLGSLPLRPDTLYIHDVALAPPARGQNAVRPRINELVEQAKAAGFPNLSLTAVSGSVGFWQKNGFLLMNSESEEKKMSSYGEEARSMVYPLV